MGLNPFDLRGPEFLVFYLVFAGLVLAGQLLARRLGERASRPRPPVDPRRIAYLRGGATEVVRVATVDLVQRGLLDASADWLVAREGAASRVTDRLDRALVAACEAGRRSSDLLSRAILDPIDREYRPQLEEMGLLVGERVRSARILVAILAIMTLVGVGLAKVMIALERGRTNVGLLIVLLIAASVVSGFLVRG